MTKKEIIKKLHDHGELWANEAYSKKELEEYLTGLEDAMPLDWSELLKHIEL